MKSFLYTCIISALAFSAKVSAGDNDGDGVQDVNTPLAATITNLNSLNSDVSSAFTNKDSLSYSNTQNKIVQVNNDGIDILPKITVPKIDTSDSEEDGFRRVKYNVPKIDYDNIFNSNNFIFNKKGNVIGMLFTEYHVDKNPFDDDSDESDE